MEKISVPGIKDFGKVNDHLYRGAQPKDDSLAPLKKLGVDTVIDLRGVLHEAVNKERRQAQGLGMQFVNLPGNGWSNPTDEQIAQFFSLILERPRRTIFIHCWLGGDRSGMFIAAYRIAFDGWTADETVDEMREFHYLEFWHPGMERYVKEFPERLAHSPELARFRQMPRSSAFTPDCIRCENPFGDGRLRERGHGCEGLPRELRRIQSIRRRLLDGVEQFNSNTSPSLCLMKRNLVVSLRSSTTGCKIVTKRGI